MKSIVVFHPSNDLYGADRILVNALQSFPEESEKIVFLPKEGPLTVLILDSVKNVQIKIESALPIIFRAIFSPLGMIKFAKNYYAFKRLLIREHSKHNFDLAYVNTLSSSFVLPILSKLKIKSFIHVHEILERPEIVARVTARMARRHSDYIICVSKAVEKNLVKFDPSIKTSCHVLHNGIQPIQNFESEENSHLTFYLFGRIMPKKGQWYLVDSLSILPEYILKKARFVIVGGPPPGREHLSESLKERIKEVGLDAVITLKGFCSDISEEMSKADVCVVPSLMKDPFPTTVLEAMSSGKPVIATNHGGAAEVIQNDVDGYLIPPNDTEQFTRVIKKVIQNSELIPEMGKKAQQRFQEGFTLERFQRNWTKLHLSKC
ncbi:MAG: glycosyltransferase family 4 protein [Crocinitomicaceae bacterium]|nr:glycosyltransferase family 4 protein [Crocinitomicaceae bacterium]